MIAFGIPFLICISLVIYYFGIKKYDFSSSPKGAMFAVFGSAIAGAFLLRELASPLR